MGFPHHDPYGETPARKRHRLQRAAGKLLPDWKVTTCGNYAGYGLEHRGKRIVAVNLGRGGCYFGHVVRCHSVWVCPSCGAAKANERRPRVRRGATDLQEAGGSGFMLTQTIGHTKGDTLKSSLQILQHCIAQTKRGGEFSRKRERHGLVATLSSREVTYGRNGWHTHAHNLNGFEKGHTPGDVGNMVDFLMDRWSQECRALGRRHSDAAQDLKHMSDEAGAAEYVTKHGIEWEMTHAHLKEAAGDAQSPWDFLDDYSVSGNFHAADRFIEFAEAFKGARQLTGGGAWRGLPGSDMEFERPVVGAYLHEATMRRLGEKGLQQEFREAFNARGLVGAHEMLCAFDCGVEGLYPATIDAHVVRPRKKRAKTEERKD